MDTFSSEDTYTLGGCRTVICIRLPRAMTFAGVRSEYIGKQVEIDGQVYRVRGVESWCISGLPAGAPIGFLVERPEEALGKCRC